MKKAIIVLCGLLWVGLCFGQAGVKGKVKDENGNPLTGVVVSVGSSDKSDVTDINGNYEIMDLDDLVTRFYDGI